MFADTLEGKKIYKERERERERDLNKPEEFFSCIFCIDLREILFSINIPKKLD